MLASKPSKVFDAERINFLRPVAEELGFKLGVANLERHITGEADDYGDESYWREWNDSHGGHSALPDMRKVECTTTEISGLVDLDGKVLISSKRVFVGEEELVPKDPFEDEEPDDTDYEGYMGNGAGGLAYWYRRSVLVLIPDRKIDDVYYSMEGILYALQKLKESTAIPPTVADRQWANRLITKGGWELDEEHAIILLDYALKWRDLTMWKDLMKLRKCTLQVVNVDMLLKAWELFSFETVRISFEQLLAHTTKESESAKYYGKAPKAFSQDEYLVLPWCQNIRMATIQSFRKIVMQNLLNKDDFEFWITFIKALREGRKTILEGAARSQILAEPAAAHDADVIDSLIQQCVQATASRWSDVPTRPEYDYYYGRTKPQNQDNTPKINRFIRIVEEAIMIPDLNICRNLFSDIIKLPGDMEIKFDEIYIPLIPQLRSLLENKQQAISTPPCVDLFQSLIGLYLENILIDKDHRDARVRKLGCGCEDCDRLDAFILNPKSSSTTFWMTQARRSHLEVRIGQAHDLCTFTTIQRCRPHGLQVTKHPKIVQVSSWESRQKAAKAFLASIGPDTVIAQIMGMRYLEVQRAIEGVARFGSAKEMIVAAPAAGASGVPQPTTMSSSSTSSIQFAVPRTSTATPMVEPVPSQIAGKKRKTMS